MKPACWFEDLIDLSTPLRSDRDAQRLRDMRHPTGLARARCTKSDFVETPAPLFCNSYKA